MIDSWVSLIAIPFLLLITGLFVEYWIIQPWRNSRVNIPTPSQVGEEWSDAMHAVVKQFKAQQTSFTWKGGQHRLVIEGWEIRKNAAKITLGVTRQKPIVDYSSKGGFSSFSTDTVPERIASFELIVNKEGQIRRLRTLSFGLESAPSTQRNISLAEKPIAGIDETEGGIILSVEFKIENTGNRNNSISAYLIYYTVNVIDDKNKINGPYTSDPTIYEILPGITNCILSIVIGYPNSPILDEPYPVSIRYEVMQ